jgi:hypothetical protein
MAAYGKFSPYYQTGNHGFFLDVMTDRKIPAIATDSTFMITKVYEYRPDMLAFDLYGSANLWWVFIQRNPNILKDPIFDFKAGTEIKLPKKATIDTSLGV